MKRSAIAVLVLGTCAAYGCLPAPLSTTLDAQGVSVQDGGNLVAKDAPIHFYRPVANGYRTLATSASDTATAAASPAPTPSVSPNAEASPAAASGTTSVGASASPTAPTGSPHADNGQDHGGASDGLASAAPDGSPAGQVPAHPQDADTPPPNTTECKEKDLGFAITYVGQTQPITIAGQVVQANDIKIEGDRAYIAYNCAGDPFLGALQIIDIHDPQHPTILKQIEFTDLDIDCVALDGNRLLFGGGANPDRFPFRSFIGAVDLNNTTPGAILDSLHGLKSYAATSIAVQGDRIYVGVGAKDGGIDVLDKGLNETAFLSAPDVRDVVPYQNGMLALSGTTDSQQQAPTLLLGDTAIQQRIPLQASLMPYTKAAVDLIDGRTALLALSNSGLIAVNLKSPQTPLYSLTNPSTSELYETNSVSSDGDLVFVANGEYGFRVLKLNGSGGFATMLGYHPMSGSAYGGQHYSANQVAFRAQNLFVASGVGGVNIYQLQRAAEAPSAAPSDAAPTDHPQDTQSPSGDAHASDRH